MSDLNVDNIEVRSYSSDRTGMDDAFSVGLSRENHVEINLNPNYRGRVRSGCLTCRKRKVKCDEQKPTCDKCRRIGKTCVYKRGIAFRQCGFTTAEIIVQDSSRADINCPKDAADHLLILNPVPCRPSEPRLITPRNASSAEIILQASIFNLEDTDELLHAMTTQDIYLTSTIDVVAASFARIHPSLKFFLHEVNPPIISNLSSTHWIAMKKHVVELAALYKTVAASALTVQLLYQALTYGLPTTHATRTYNIARAILDTDLDKEDEDRASKYMPENVVIGAFLLCLFETDMACENQSTFLNPSAYFLRQLKQLFQITEMENYHFLPHISSWLRMLHATSRRGGGPGIVSKEVLEILLDAESDMSESIDGTSSTEDELFRFYTALQDISTKIVDSSHYHRSRIETKDQAEVSAAMSTNMHQLNRLWENRPAIIREETQALQAHSSRTSVDVSLAELAGVCAANYWAEVVEVGRLLSEPPLAGDKSKHAMRKIRDIIDKHRAAKPNTKLNPGYQRPLFMYVIESMRKDEAEWAVARLRDIKTPISRSDFFATFAEALAEAQRSKRRRVTYRWFCYQAFVMPPPPL